MSSERTSGTFRTRSTGLLGRGHWGPRGEREGTRVGPGQWWELAPQGRDRTRQCPRSLQRSVAGADPEAVLPAQPRAQRGPGGRGVPQPRDGGAQQLTGARAAARTRSCPAARPGRSGRGRRRRAAGGYRGLPAPSGAASETGRQSRSLPSPGAQRILPAAPPPGPRVPARPSHLPGPRPTHPQAPPCPSRSPSAVGALVSSVPITPRQPCVPLSRSIVPSPRLPRVPWSPPCPSRSPHGVDALGSPAIPRSPHSLAALGSPAPPVLPGPPLTPWLPSKAITGPGAPCNSNGRRCVLLRPVPRFPPPGPVPPAAARSRAAPAPPPPRAARAGG